MVLSKVRHDWPGPLITAVLSIIGTLGVMRSDALKFETSQQQVAFERIAHLEKRIDELHKTIVAQSATIAGLQAQLASQPDPVRALYAYLEGIDSPAWLKLYHPDENRFRMLYINRAYEGVYSVSRARYIGATDFEVHSEDRAMLYHQNDLRVISQKDFSEFVEPALHKGSDGIGFMPVRFWKFYVMLPDGRELVAGVQVGPDDG